MAIAEEVVAELPAEAKRGWKQVTDNYRIESPGLEPIVALLFTKIAEEITDSDGRLEWASTSSRTSDPSPTAALSQ